MKKGSWAYKRRQQQLRCCMCDFVATRLLITQLENCKRSSDRGAGKWLPYDLNGTVHECKNKNQKPVQQTREPEQKPLTLEQMDIRLKRVEKVLFNEGK